MSRFSAWAWAGSTATKQAAAADREREVVQRASDAAERHEETKRRMLLWSSHWLRTGAEPSTQAAAEEAILCAPCDGEGLFRNRDEGGWCAVCKGTGVAEPVEDDEDEARERAQPGADVERRLSQGGE